MAFDSLTDKLQNVFRKLRSKGTITEADVKEAMKEVKRALLEADVNFKVVKQFINSVSERAVGEEVLKGLNPGQMVIKIVKEEMDKLMGSETTELKLLPSNEITIVMMCGLQGAGKTTTVAKLAGKFKNKGKKPLLVACDVYRPAAIKQLEINGEKVGVPVFSMGDGHKPVNIAKAAIEHAAKNDINLVFLDTAGRLHVDEDMMNELAEIKENLNVTYTILTVDAMTGQDAVNVATSFNDKIGIDGVILTKLDGDTRGGAALSIKAVTGKPILYAGMGEKLTDLEQFYPDRMASRILGMGDVESLIEKAQSAIDEEKAKEMEEKFKKASFDFNDFLDQMEQMEKMGGMNDILKMLPGFGNKKQLQNLEIDDNAMNMPKAIILSMTKQERSHPEIINPSRKKRIADGAGVPISEVNKLIKQFEQSRKKCH
jgi:signal recognition particle subunit SRP54